MHVLLVEDDIPLGQAIEMAFARWSHASVWVRDGKDALAAARSSAFDLIVLDLGVLLISVPKVPLLSLSVILAAESAFPKPVRHLLFAVLMGVLWGPIGRRT